MQANKESSGFFSCLMFNMLLNLAGLLPAIILLVLYFTVGWSYWWAVAAAGIWLAVIFLWTAVISWSAKCGSEPEPQKENKNPYSVGGNAK